MYKKDQMIHNKSKYKINLEKNNDVICKLISRKDQSDKYNLICLMDYDDLPSQIPYDKQEYNGLIDIFIKQNYFYSSGFQNNMIIRVNHANSCKLKYVPKNLHCVNLEDKLYYNNYFLDENNFYEKY
jgi:hypothetical protein